MVKIPKMIFGSYDQGLYLLKDLIPWKFNLILMYDFYGSFLTYFCHATTWVELFFKLQHFNYVFLCLTANKSADVDSKDTSPATLAKHYKALQTLYKRKNPNHQDVSHVLDLEFVARRAFIDSNTIREEDRHEKVLEAYPCFKDVVHVSHYWLCMIKTMVSHTMFKIPISS